MRYRCVAIAVALGFSALSSIRIANAQDPVFVQDKKLNWGEPIRTSTMEYSLGLAAEFGYDSNPLLRADSPSEPRVDALKLRVTPSFGFQSRVVGDAGKDNRGPIALQGNVAVTYFEFFKGTIAPTTEDITRLRNVGVVSNIGVTIAPGSKINGELNFGLNRTIQPSNLGGLSNTLNRTVPKGQVAINWVPGGGLFVWKIFYSGTFQYFESDTFNNINSFTHTIGTSGTWRFFPRTSLIFDSKADLIRYTDQNAFLPNGDVITSRIGLNGLFFNNFGFLAVGGIATSMFDSKGGAIPQDFSSPVAQAEFRYYPSGNSSKPGVPSLIGLGYLRDFHQAYIGNFYRRDRGYLTLSALFGSSLIASLNGGGGLVSFPNAFFANGQLRQVAFSSVAIDASAFLEYRVVPWLGINLTGSYTSLLSDVLIPFAPGAGTVGADDISFQRIEGYLGVRVIR